MAKTKNTSTKKNDITSKPTDSKLSNNNKTKKSTLKILIICAGVLILSGISMLFIFGRVRIIDNAMENTITKGTTLWLNKISTPNYNDIVAYRHPETDSIVVSAKDKNYYKMCRKYGNSWVSKAEVIKQDFHKMPIFISRCIAMPGDLVEIKNNQVFVNKNKSQYDTPSKQLYYITTEGIINPNVLEEIGLTKNDLEGETDYLEDFLNIYRQKTKTYGAVKIFSTDKNALAKLKEISVIKKIEPVVLPKEYFEPTVFPYNKDDAWNESNFGPLIIPKEGKIIKFSSIRIANLYRRIIEAYEKNKMEIKGNKIFINGKETNSYRFTQNYYFVINDNRASKNDSRFFGLLPEKNIVGVTY